MPRAASGPVLRAIAYADRKGRSLAARSALPPVGIQAHADHGFVPHPAAVAETARLLVDDMLAHGLRGGLTFSPGGDRPSAVDLVPFPRVAVVHQFYRLPLHARPGGPCRAAAGQESRSCAGFTCTRTGNLQDALHCLSGSEKRKGFSYGISLRGLELAHRLRPRGATGLCRLCGGRRTGRGQGPPLPARRPSVRLDCGNGRPIPALRGHAIVDVHHVRGLATSRAMDTTRAAPATKRSPWPKRHGVGG